MAKSAKPAKGKITKLTTPVFRLSFAQALFKAQAAQNEDGTKGTPKFGFTAIWTPAKFTPRDKELWQMILRELDRVSRETFGKAWKELPANIKRGLRNGNEKADVEGFGDGTRFANLTTQNPIGVVTLDGIEISVAEGNTAEVYPGCYCRATVNVYSYNKKFKGVGIGVQNLQKVKDGPRLDNRTAAADDFDEELDGAWLDESDDLDNDGDDSDFE